MLQPQFVHVVREDSLEAPTIAAGWMQRESLPAVLAMRTSQDAIEGPLAFAEHRQPRWRSQ